MTIWLLYQKHHEKVEKGFTLGKYLLSAVSAAWVLFMLMVAKNELHLVIWIEKDTTVYPSDKTVTEALPLTFEGTPANLVRVLSVKISNYGKSIIGKQESTWNLTVKSADATPIAIVGEPVKAPGVLVFEQLPREKSKPDTVNLKIGALEPKATIDFKAMLLNSTNPRTGGLTIAHSLDGLPSETAVRSAEDRIFDRTASKIVLLSGLLFMLGFARAAYVEARSRSLPKDLDKQAEVRAYLAWEKDGFPQQTQERAAQQFVDAKKAIVAETPVVWSVAWRLAAYFFIGLLPGMVVAKVVARVVSWL